MKFIDGDGQEVIHAKSAKPPVDGRMIHDTADLRRARDLAWIMLIREGWRSREIAAEFGYGKSQVCDRVLEFVAATGLSVTWQGRSKNVEASRLRVFRKMNESGYTDLDLADIWNVSINKTRQMLKG